MKAFQSLTRPRMLYVLAVLGIVSAMLLSLLPVAASAQPRPPVEYGDPTDTDYGPAPKKSAAILAGYEPASGGDRFDVPRHAGLRRAWWLSRLLTDLWRYSALR